MNITLAIVLLCFLLFPQPSFAQENEKQQVRTTLEHYMSADAARLEKAFDPSATIKFTDYKTGEFRTVPIADYIEGNRKNPPAASSGTTKEILYIDVQGTCAQAKIKIERSDMILYDYMNLVKVQGNWKIVSKIFSRHEKK